MKRDEQIQKELAEIGSGLADLRNTIPYHIPENYFESFPGKMLTLVRLNEQHSNETARQEIATLSPLLDALKDKKTLQVPDNYFAQLAKDAIDAVRQNDAPAPVISINTPFVKSWKRYAVAAIIIGFIGIASLLVWNRAADKNQLVANQKGLQNENAEMPELSEETLASYLKALPGNENTQLIDSADAEFYDLALLKVDDAKLVNILESVPEDELANYELDL